jgi:TfoX/Sxy family transcriptional regulator of competence genes
MPWKKAPVEMITLLDRFMESYPATRKTMFGYPVYFVNGNMFMGLFEESLFLRLPDDQVGKLQKEGHSIAFLEPMKGRPMKNYFVIPSEIYDRKDFGKVLTEAIEFAQTLKPKEKKSGK